MLLNKKNNELKRYIYIFNGQLSSLRNQISFDIIYPINDRSWIKELGGASNVFHSMVDGSNSVSSCSYCHYDYFGYLLL